MLSNSMGLILADHDRVHLGDLTGPRALAAVPFGGRYRIVDFMLSSMVNSGIKYVGLVAMTKYKSLMDHIGTGAFWDLDRMRQGLSILPPYINSSYFDRESGDLTGLVEFISRGKESYVVIADSNVVMNINFEEFIGNHAESGADMTIMYNRDCNRFGSPTFSLELERGKLVDLMVDATEPGTLRSAIGVLVINRPLLLQILSQAMARGHNEFSIELLLKMYQRYKIRGYEYKDLCLRINSVASYFKASMRLLEPEVRQNLFNNDRPIYTKIKNLAPAFYEASSTVSNCLLSDGCHLFGEVKDSILFRGVRIGKHAQVHNCVLMQDVEIGEGAVLNNVIIDKDTVIRPGVKLQGQADYPVVIGKGALV